MPSGLGGVFSELISPTKRPDVPAAPYVNPGEAQQQAINANLSSLPSLERLGAATNQWQLGQNQQLLGQAIPNFNQLTGTASNNLLSWEHGQIPTDVANQVATSAAGRALAGGYGGSGMANNLTARDLGLTSLGLQQQAQQLLPGYLGTMHNLLMPQSFNLQSSFLSPGQVISADQWNENNRYGQQWLQNQINALPDPLMNAVGQFVGDTTNTLVNAAELGASGGLVGGIGTGGSTGGGGLGGVFGSLFGGGNGGGGNGGGGNSYRDPNFNQGDAQAMEFWGLG